MIEIIKEYDGAKVLINAALFKLDLKEEGIITLFRQNLRGIASKWPTLLGYTDGNNICEEKDLKVLKDEDVIKTLTGIAALMKFSVAMPNTIRDVWDGDKLVRGKVCQWNMGISHATGKVCIGNNMADGMTIDVSGNEILISCDAQYFEEKDKIKEAIVESRMFVVRRFSEVLACLSFNKDILEQIADKYRRIVIDKTTYQVKATRPLWGNY